MIKMKGTIKRWRERRKNILRCIKCHGILIKMNDRLYCYNCKKYKIGGIRRK